MIKLFDVNEQKWLEIVSLSVHEEQKKYLDEPIGIIVSKTKVMVRKLYA